ncbi:MAG TPA: FlgD immunoglobulin-like domain containing protein [Candidatus Cloacimonas sp.]|nr:FlgD immunoglobulin-like domain containing protein [Candidatus Cloacimonas sp.]
MKKPFLPLLLLTALLLGSFPLWSSGYSLSFVGSTPSAPKYVNCGTNAAFNIPNSNFTIEAWIYPTNFSSTKAMNTIVGKDDWSSGSPTYSSGYVFRYGSSNRTLSFAKSNGTTDWYEIYANNVLTLNTWQHVAITQSMSGSNSTMTLYVNGVQVGSPLTATTASTQSSRPVYIGYSPNTQSNIRCMLGNVDEVRIWNVTRSATQLADNRYVNIDPSTTGLIAYYKMSEGTGTTVADSSPNHIDGTFSATAPSWDTNIPFDYPGAATTPNPETNATNIGLRPSLSWSAPASGNPTGYKVFLGTDNPPSDVLNGVSQSSSSYTLSDNLQYNTKYYWKIVPYNATGDAQSPDTWEFTTTDLYADDLPAVTDGEGNTVNPQIQIPSITGIFNPVITTDWAPEGTPVNYPGLYILLSGGTFTGRTIQINPDLGYIPAYLMYRVLPSQTWVKVSKNISWTVDLVDFTISAGKADGDVEIVFFNGEDETLPVELSSFTAFITADNFVTLNWITQSETNIAGYNIYRNTWKNLSDAIKLSCYLTAENSSSTHSYSYTDAEIFATGTYFYWLQANELNGDIDYFGPVSVTIANNNPENPPQLIERTELGKMFPNPFSSDITIGYNLKAADNVILDIYNSKGQFVRHYQQNYNTMGAFHYVWDGKSDSGKAMPSGVYYLKMKATNYSGCKKMIYLK